MLSNVFNYIQMIISADEEGRKHTNRTSLQSGGERRTRIRVRRERK
jgi:hypothetical protein